MIKRDYLERLIEELAALATRVTNLMRDGKPEEASREIDIAYRLVGLPARVLDVLDQASIRMMAGDKVHALAQLLEIEAQYSEQVGDHLRARRRRALAQAMMADGASNK